MPSWAKLRFPEPSVSTAKRRFSVLVLSADDSAFSGPMTSSPPTSPVLFSSVLGCWLPVLFLFPVVVLAIVVVSEVAAFWAAENTDEKNPLAGRAVPPGVLISSSVGVRGADMELESLLGGFVAERTRLCDIMFPEGDTTTFGFDCDGVCFVPVFEFAVEPVGDGGFASVGVGGVTKVVGASTTFGGVTGVKVMILLGVLATRFGVDCVAWPSCICGGDPCSTAVSSKTLEARCRPPKSVPKPPPLVLGLEFGGLLLDLGEVERR
jgi:hypothetical protein